MIGDSHATAAFNAVSYYLAKDHGLTVVNLAGSLFSDVVNAPLGSKIATDSYLGGFEVADYVEAHPELSTIIMVSRGFFYLDWAHNFSIPSKPHIVDKEEVYVEGVQGLFDRFKDRKIIFVLENPTLNFSPKNCAGTRPLNLMVSPCKITREYDDSVHSVYINKITALAREYPNVVLVDPRDVMCDSKHCYASMHSKVLYSDTDHLNTSGNLLIGLQISEALNRF